MKKLSFICIILVLLSCTRTVVLKNGYTRAPTNSKVFKNRIFFDKSILTQIDTAVIYEELNDNFYRGGIKQDNVLARHNFNNPNTLYGVYRFYGNGCYNLFHLDREKTPLTVEMFDPDHTGWRGVLYKKNDKIMGDMFTQIGQLSWQRGKLKEEFTFNGDTLFIELTNSRKYIYIKRHIDLNLLKHNADW